jgi:hypothetical protein
MYTTGFSRALILHTIYKLNTFKEMLTEKLFMEVIIIDNVGIQQ